jgi:hypothetical protein
MSRPSPLPRAPAPLPACSDRCRNSLGVPLATIRPRSIMMARVQAASTSSRMCVEKTMALFAHPPDQLPHLMFLIWIQAVGRFIQHQHLRIMNNRLRKTGPVPIALRQRLNTLMQHRLQKTGLHDPVHRLLLRLAPHPPQLRRKAKKTVHRHVGVSRRILRQISQATAWPESVPPACRAVPPAPNRLGGMKPVIMRIVVDLPAPLGPRNPSTSPFSTVNETSSTARFGPNDLVKCSTVIMRLLSYAQPFQELGSPVSIQLNPKDQPSPLGKSLNQSAPGTNAGPLPGRGVHRFLTNARKNVQTSPRRLYQCSATCLNHPQTAEGFSAGSSSLPSPHAARPRRCLQQI